MTTEIDIRHPDYIAMHPRWQRCLDVVDGQDAVHAAGEEYLPRLPVDADTGNGNGNTAYHAYVRRAGWYGATARTIQNMLGLVFRNAPQKSLDAFDEQWLQDITLTGLSVDAFARQALEATLVLGRGAVLLDYPRTPEGVITRAQAEAAQLRPYWAWYDAMSIVNWRYERIGGRYQLASVVLREEDALASAFDEFEDATRVTYRLCRLVESAGRLVYTQQVATVVEDDTVLDANALTWSEQLPVVVNGATLEHIPLYWFHGHENDTLLKAPPLIDLVNKNLEYYAVTAQHRHGMHWTALPTPWAVGIREEEQDSINEIGPRKIWFSSNDQAKFGMLEYTGVGLQTLADERVAIKDEMAKLGARMLTSQRGSGVRTATEVESDVASETSQLSRIASRVSEQVTALLSATAAWAGADEASVEDIAYTLNSDFVNTRLDAAELTALVAAWQSGAISHETLLWNLKEGELLEPGHSVEEELEAVEGDAGGGVGVLGEAAE